MNKKKGSANLGYLVMCKMQNGNVIPAFTDSFSSATEIADMMIGGEYAVEVKILKISTGAMFEYVI
jgi:hypothetical protein|nr:MAG TPA: hypothetical protein [Caudoviricetes sp.]